MFTNPIDARDEMFQLFDDGWANVTVLPQPPEIRWQGKEKGEIPSDYFVRVSTQNVGQPQGGFYQGDGPGVSPPVYDPFGLLFVQVHAPKDAEDSYRNGELLAIAGRDIFRGATTPGGIWFRNCRYIEVPAEPKFYRWNVIVEWEFSER